MSFLENFDDWLDDWVFRISGLMVLLIGTCICVAILVFVGAAIYYGVASL